MKGGTLSGATTIHTRKGRKGRARCMEVHKHLKKEGVATKIRSRFNIPRSKDFRETAIISGEEKEVISAG